MDVWFLRILFFTFVHTLLVLGVKAQIIHDSEGRVCVTSDGDDGKCLQLPLCPRVLSAITRGIRNHTRCGFIGAIELVCCAQESVNFTTNPILKLHTSMVLPPTTPSLQSSTRGAYWLPLYMEESVVTSVRPTITTHVPTTSTTVKPRNIDERENELEDVNLDSNRVNEDVEDLLLLENKGNNKISPTLFAFNTVTTVRPTITTHVPTTSTTVKPRETYVDERENELEDLNLDSNRVNEDVEDRLLLGNKDKNKISPTIFAFNTLTGFVNAILGKPPTSQPNPTQLPPLLRPATKPPTPIYTTPLYILHNERFNTRKPGSFHLPTMFPLLSSSTQKTILNIQPNEIQTYKPKPSQEPVRDPNHTSTRPITYSTIFSAINNVRPEHTIMKPSPLPEVSTKKPFVLPYLPLTEKPSADDITVPTALPQATHSSETPFVENVETLSPASSEEVEFSTIPEIPGLEPVATEIPVWSDKQTQPPEVLVIPDVPYLTPIPPENPDGDFTTLEPITAETSSKETPGTKSQEACARYKEIPKLTRYIVGGDYAAHGEFPHMVALGFQRPRQANLTWMCGGTLLNEEYVLTAAHCVVTRFGRPVAVRVGYTNLTADASTGLELTVRDATVHPGYNAATRAHDVAVLRLASPVAYSQFVHPACLHAAHAPPPGLLIVTGWGSVTPDGTTPTDHLKRALVTHVNDSSCRQIYRNIFRTEMICAISDEVDTCKGDSGGPMQYLEDANSTIYTVVGVTSFGPNPCATGRPGVYSRVASYLPWIEGVAWPN